jgi:hypothetical protein
MAQGDQVIGVSDHHRGSRSRVSDVCAGQLPDPGGFFHPVQGDVQQQFDVHTSNIVANWPVRSGRYRPPDAKPAKPLATIPITQVHPFMDLGGPGT